MRRPISALLFAFLPCTLPGAPPEPPPHAAASPSGLRSDVLRPGRGTAAPGPGDVVRFHYRGWTAEGTLFDETTQREPVTARMDRLIKGLREGLALMTEGERRRLWVPRAMGFLGIPGKPQGDLVLEVELLAVLPPPQTPADVAAPPPDALQGPGGLRYRILQAGTGTRHPGRRDRVTVHYSGWTTDGKLFDSSLQRDAPQTFALDEVIKGWSRGLPLLVEGDRARFWIPARMAYQGEEGKPQGMLVFDIQLLKVWN